MTKFLVICNGRTCTKYGSLGLLKFIRQKQIKGLTIKTQYCFGKCGNGCVVLYLPEEKFYTYVNKKTLLALVNS